MLRLIWLTLSLLVASPPATAVELDDNAYQQVVAEVQSIYSEGTGANLAFLRSEVEPGKIHYWTDNPRHGQLWLRTPIRSQDVYVLQVPHKFFDLHTDEIGQAWFQAGYADLLMENTEHRHKTDNSDLSRLAKTLFTAWVEALIALDKKVSVVQVHGYSIDFRKTASARTTDFILSNGTTAPGSAILAMQSCLRDNANLLARAYGRDVFELGATINPVGRLINRQTNNKARFLHIEMPRSTRLGLVEGQIPGEAIACFFK